MENLPALPTTKGPAAIFKVDAWHPRAVGQALCVTDEEYAG
jgi:hypothetical protein